MTKNEFFKRPNKHTRLKSQIISKYFMPWSRIVGNINSKITYLDLFAGNGKFSNGELGTALGVIEESAKVDKLRQDLLIVLNEKERRFYQQLIRTIDEEGMAYGFNRAPIYYNKDALNLIDEIEDIKKQGPMFTFIDPSGYKGVTQDLIRQVLDGKGNDCMVFLATDYIVRFFKKNSLEKYFIELFGLEEFKDLKREYYICPGDKHILIMDFFKRACLRHSGPIGLKYVLPLTIYKEKKNHISHHLVFLSKHHLAFKIMKDIMADPSDKVGEIPVFKYRESCIKNGVPLEFDHGLSLLNKLKEKIIIDFSGRELSVKDLKTGCHKLGYMYLEKNIKKALTELMKEGRLRLIPDPSTKGENITDKRRIIIN